METEEKKPGKVVSVCPVCKKKVRMGDRIKVHQNWESIPGSNEAGKSLLKTTCLKCGVEYLMPRELKELNRVAVEGERKIIIPT